MSFASGTGEMSPYGIASMQGRSAADAALAEFYGATNATTTSLPPPLLGVVAGDASLQSLPPDHPSQPHPLLTERFMLRHFKIAPCPRNEVHDWSLCPYSHVGEKAQRRNPFLETGEELYTGIACPSMKSVSSSGDAFERARV